MKLSQSPVVLLCYAYVGGSGEIFLFPFSLWIRFFNQWLHTSENFHVSEWRRPNVPADPMSHCDISFPTAWDKNIAPEKSLFVWILIVCSWGMVVVFCFIWFCKDI